MAQVRQRSRLTSDSETQRPTSVQCSNANHAQNKHQVLLCV